MAIEKTFVKEGIKESEIETYLKERFSRAGYSHSEIQRTPVGTRIIVYANKPGLVIGRSGRRVTQITEDIKKKFGFENPLIDVREVGNPFLDAKIVASRIGNALERGIHYKRVCNYYVQKIMEAGAIGVQIEASGKLAGTERSRFQKFRDGYITHSGDYAEKLVDKGFSKAMLKPGMAGITVKIMIEPPKELIIEQGLRKIAQDKENEKKEREEIEKEKANSEKEKKAEETSTKEIEVPVEEKTSEEEKRQEEDKTGE